MKISEYLSTDVIIPDLKGNNKIEIINELINLYKENNKVSDLEKVRTAVLERENIMSTGVGKGFALPHGKTESVNDIIAAFGKSNKPIDYQALDQQPVYLVFLLVGKDNLVSAHIKLLSRISRMMNKEEFREKLKSLNTAEEIFEAFKLEEATYFDT